MKYRKLQLETILFNNEDIITTSGNNEYTQPPVVPPTANPPQPQPGTQDGQDSEFIS